ncbi:hypothetical protein LTR36_009366 [Oleoguttula mirabilis]|uniref:Uncharacterized protein n=1 Tax=Oleoguttula mirabilis TaxID=1507867 RepID=A0AAV9JTP9_9PEZI|nr:hypothetical protein LTR36_009366 [Oleoguttula mirabilis]
MRDNLGWNTCTYFIGNKTHQRDESKAEVDDDAATVPDINGTERSAIRDNLESHERLENVVFTLRSHIRHPSEKLVVYYGGYAAANNEEVPGWMTDCGAMLHGTDGHANCVTCVPHIDPSSFSHSSWN